MTHLRAQCPGCPWRDMDAMRRDHPAVVAHAEANPGDQFVCHERCGPCDGPKIAARKQLARA